MATVIPLPPVPTLPVVGSADLFPLRRVYCVGRNYAAHAREMGHSDKEPPFFFSKPADAVFYPADGTLPYPPATGDLHHEVELVVALKSGGADISPETALSHVYGYGVGVDLTRRDIQAIAKKASRPWEMAKGFDASGPVGKLVPMDGAALSDETAIALSVDGVVRQQGSLADMIWPVADVIAHLSTMVTLAAGDLIFTGTPEGVGPVARQQTIVASVEGLPSLTFTLR